MSANPPKPKSLVPAQTRVTRSPTAASTGRPLSKSSAQPTKTQSSQNLANDEVAFSLPPRVSGQTHSLLEVQMGPVQWLRDLKTIPKTRAKLRFWGETANQHAVVMLPLPQVDKQKTKAAAEKDENNVEFNWSRSRSVWRDMAPAKMIDLNEVQRRKRLEFVSIRYEIKCSSSRFAAYLKDAVALQIDLLPSHSTFVYGTGLLRHLDEVAGAGLLDTCVDIINDTGTVVAQLPIVIHLIRLETSRRSDAVTNSSSMESNDSRSHSVAGQELGPAPVMTAHHQHPPVPVTSQTLDLTMHTEIDAEARQTGGEEEEGDRPQQQAAATTLPIHASFEQRVEIAEQAQALHELLLRGENLKLAMQQALDDNATANVNVAGLYQPLDNTDANSSIDDPMKDEQLLEDLYYKRELTRLDSDPKPNKLAYLLDPDRLNLLRLCDRCVVTVVSFAPDDNRMWAPGDEFYVDVQYPGQTKSSRLVQIERGPLTFVDFTTTYSLSQPLLENALEKHLGISFSIERRKGVAHYSPTTLLPLMAVLISPSFHLRTPLTVQSCGVVTFDVEFTSSHRHIEDPSSIGRSFAVFDDFHRLQHPHQPQREYSLLEEDILRDLALQHDPQRLCDDVLTTMVDFYKGSDLSVYFGVTKLHGFAESQHPHLCCRMLKSHGEQGPFHAINNPTLEFDVHLINHLDLDITQLDDLQRTSMVIECWDGADLIGLSKLPLRPLFDSLRIHMETHEVGKPIVLLDDWCDIICPVSDRARGSLKCLLAVGSSTSIRQFSTETVRESQRDTNLFKALHKVEPRVHFMENERNHDLPSKVEDEETTTLTMEHLFTVLIEKAQLSPSARALFIESEPLFLRYLIPGQVRSFSTHSVPAALENVLFSSHQHAIINKPSLDESAAWTFELVQRHGGVETSIASGQLPMHRLHDLMAGEQSSRQAFIVELHTADSQGVLGTVELTMDYDRRSLQDHHVMLVSVSRAAGLQTAFDVLFQQSHPVKALPQSNFYVTLDIANERLSSDIVRSSFCPEFMMDKCIHIDASLVNHDVALVRLWHSTEHEDVFLGLAEVPWSPASGANGWFPIYSAHNDIEETLGAVQVTITPALPPAEVAGLGVFERAQLRLAVQSLQLPGNYEIADHEQVYLHYEDASHNNDIDGHSLLWEDCQVYTLSHMILDLPIRSHQQLNQLVLNGIVVSLRLRSTDQTIAQAILSLAELRWNSPVESTVLLVFSNCAAHTGGLLKFSARLNKLSSSSGTPTRMSAIKDENVAASVQDGPSVEIEIESARLDTSLLGSSDGFYVTCQHRVRNTSQSPKSQTVRPQHAPIFDFRTTLRLEEPEADDYGEVFVLFWSERGTETILLGSAVVCIDVLLSNQLHEIDGWYHMKDSDSRQTFGQVKVRLQLIGYPTFEYTPPSITTDRSMTDEELRQMLRQNMSDLVGITRHLQEEYLDIHHEQSVLQQHDANDFASQLTTGDNDFEESRHNSNDDHDGSERARACE